MTRIVSTDITSPLGVTTEQNYRALRDGRTALQRYDSWMGLPVPVAAAIITDESLLVEGCTRFESFVIRSVEEALSHADIDVASDRTVFILSTTKADVAELGEETYLSPGAAARKISRHFGFVNEPIVVCNACISGVSALLLAHRLMLAGKYDTAVVCGADCVSSFNISGFTSFKALSPFACRPFDIERLGLNLGEAAATMVLRSGEGDGWVLREGCVNNDAYHISAPAPDGDGVFRAIRQTIGERGIDDLATVTMHGTATMFNDQMESMAIERAGLSAIPASALKGYYGHTLGASGILETIATMRALEDGIVLPTYGFEEIGVSGKIAISAEERRTDKQSFLKVISGFGGCNGALLFCRNEKGTSVVPQKELKTIHSVHITPDSVTVDGEALEVSSTGKSLLTELYKAYVGNYPKFYKMDMFSRLVLVASELLLAKAPQDPDRSVILFNGSSSIVADRQHLPSFCDPENFYPSPSVFVYTLPNIALGEVAIKQGYKGETSLYILEERNDSLISDVVSASLSHSGATSALTGWADCSDENTFEADIKIVTI